MLESKDSCAKRLLLFCDAKQIFLGTNTEFFCSPKPSDVVSVNLLWASVQLLRGPFLKPDLKLAIWTSNVQVHVLFHAEQASYQGI